MKIKNKSRILKQLNAVGASEYFYPPPPPIRNDLLPSFGALQSWSRKVRGAANYQCQICGYSKKIDIISHHILHKSEYPELALVFNNGISLCELCEGQAHGKLLLEEPPSLKLAKRFSVLRLAVAQRRRPEKLYWWQKIRNFLRI